MEHSKKLFTLSFKQKHAIFLARFSFLHTHTFVIQALKTQSSLLITHLLLPVAFRPEVRQRNIYSHKPIASPA